MPTSNIIHRILHIKYKDSTGTAFTIDVDNRQYLITAKHVVNGIKEDEIIEVFHDNKWKLLVIRPIYLSNKNVDIIVLTFQQQITPATNLILTSDQLQFGADIYFMGFPYGISTNVGDLNYRFPLPLVKKGIVSGSSENHKIWLLDGHNNPGFSGGPAIYFPNNNKKITQVFAVVSGFRFNNEPIFDENGELTPLQFKYNTGIIVTWDIRFAIEAIKDNPIGFEINE